MRLGKYKGRGDLPDTIPVFPLPGALLLPHWHLQLNIFEPRYLAMINRALSTDRLIGMIQPIGRGTGRPELARTGCAGRITTYHETNDGRFEIALTGVVRFGVSSEAETSDSFRTVRPDYDPYLIDLSPKTSVPMPDRATLVAALREYVEGKNMEIDFAKIESADAESIVNVLACGCPFLEAERQALLEAPDLMKRAEILMTLLKMDMPGDDSGTLQ